MEISRIETSNEEAKERRREARELTEKLRRGEITGEQYRKTTEKWWENVNNKNNRIKQQKQERNVRIHKRKR